MATKAHSTGGIWRSPSDRKEVEMGLSWGCQLPNNDTKASYKNLALA